MKLTDVYIKSIKAGDKPKKYFDGGGLYLHVYPTGGKLWQMAYRFERKQKTLSVLLPIFQAAFKRELASC